MRAGGAHGERVAIGVRARRDLGADGAARAAAIINHHLLAEFFAKPLAYQARHDVRRAARREGNDQAYRLGGIFVLRSRRTAKCSARRQHRIT